MGNMIAVGQEVIFFRFKTAARCHIIRIPANDNLEALELVLRLVEIIEDGADGFLPRVGENFLVSKKLDLPNPTWWIKFPSDYRAGLLSATEPS